MPKRAALLLRRPLQVLRRQGNLVRAVLQALQAASPAHDRLAAPSCICA
jgi:hypothetical protein